MNTVGPTLFALRANGQYQSGVGTLFPHQELLITWPPMHYLQRLDFMSWYSAERARKGEKPPSDANVAWEASESVILNFMPGDIVLIRPELERLDLALEGDLMLQKLWGVPRHRIRYQSVQDPLVRQALRERGELWRMTAPPTDPQLMGQAVAQSRTGIQEGSIYYYNATTGTRWVTYEEFERLGQLEDAALARQLEEIAIYCAKRNHNEAPEIGFFGVDALRFGAPNLAGQSFVGLEAGELRARHQSLCRQFRDAVRLGFERDDPQSKGWLLAMHDAISSGKRDGLVPEHLPGRREALPVRWLPGGHFEKGEFIFAPIFGPADGPPKEAELKPLWDPLARGFIANLIREFGKLEYLNLGRIEAAPGTIPSSRGRRGVYLVELKVRGEPQPRTLFLRVLRWGIRERLADRDAHGNYKDLMAAILETQEYVEYTLDRRLGCLQFGMTLPPRYTLRRVTERYEGIRQEFHGQYFPVDYFEREFLPGVPSNAVSERKLSYARYALALARLLGQAAATNIVVGRTLDPVNPATPGQPIFDDGDEIIVESSDGLPHELVLVDHSGAFADWRTPGLLPFARAYAEPVNQRASLLPDPRTFADAYLEAFHAEFLRLQADYEQRQEAFDGLFKHLPCNPAGNFVCRWQFVLERLKSARVEPLLAAIRQHITVLS